MAPLLQPPCRCRPRHLGRLVDTEALNAATAARLEELRGKGREADCLIVPGYTPRIGWRRGGLHPKGAERCRAAAADLRAGVAPMVIVSGAAVHGDDNEAVVMREALLAEGIAADRIWVEPCARHSTTNLRNAGRIMLALRLEVALIVTSDISLPPPLRYLSFHRYFEQANYFAYPRLSTFHLRCRRQLGYTVGELAWVRPRHVRFVPSPACLSGSARTAADGDP